MNRLKFLSAVFLFVFFMSGVSAQTSQQLLSKFEQKKYAEVRAELETKLNSGKMLSDNDAVFLIKSYNRLSEYDPAIAFTHLFDKKSILNEQEFVAEKAFAMFQKDQFKPAAGSYINAYQINPSGGEFVLKSLAAIWTEKLTWNEIYELLGLFYNGRPESDFLIRMTMSNITNYSELDSFSKWIDQNISVLAQRKAEFKSQAESILKANIGQTVKVGLLLPLGKKMTAPTEKVKIGRSILTGFMTGLETIGISGTTQISLYIRDTEGDSLKAISEAKKMFDSDKVSLIIGPVFSDECYGVSKLAEHYKIPVISPTASDDDLSKDSNYFFQMNPNLSTRGRLSAQEALKYAEVVKDTVLIVTEEFSDSQILGNAFETVMKDSNVTVVDRGNYPYGVEDIRRYLPYAQRDTTQLKDFIYAPIEDDLQIDIVVPQLSYLKVFGMYVGNSLWDNRLKLRNYKSILNGMLICKDSHVDSSRADVRLFSKNYRLRYFENPISTAFRGFDSFLLTKKLTENKVLGLPDSAKRIKEFPPVKGLQSVITFNGTTVNQYMTFLRFVNNEIIPASPEQSIHADPNK